MKLVANFLSNLPQIPEVLVLPVGYFQIRRKLQRYLQLIKERAARIYFLIIYQLESRVQFQKYMNLT